MQDKEQSRPCMIFQRFSKAKHAPLSVDFADLELFSKIKEVLLEICKQLQVSQHCIGKLQSCQPNQYCSYQALLVFKNANLTESTSRWFLIVMCKYTRSILFSFET